MLSVFLKKIYQCIQTHNMYIKKYRSISCPIVQRLLNFLITWPHSFSINYISYLFIQLYTCRTTPMPYTL